MALASIKGEYAINNAREFATFGKPLTANNPETDPSSCCLPGSFLNCPLVADVGNCPSYMSEKCAKNWDSTCDLYLNSIDDNMVLKQFVRDTATKKFCRLSDDSNCKKVCQSFSPVTNDTQHQFCEDWGNETLKNSKDSIDIGYYTNVNVSPDYLGKCKKTCDVVKGEDIKNDDVITNVCLRYGFCNDILTNVCQLVGKSSNDGLNKYCNILDKPADKPAVVEKQKSVKLENIETPPKDDKKEFFILFFLVLVVLCFVLFTGKK